MNNTMKYTTKTNENLIIKKLTKWKRGEYRIYRNMSLGFAIIKTLLSHR